MARSSEETEREATIYDPEIKKSIRNWMENRVDSVLARHFIARVANDLKDTTGRIPQIFLDLNRDLANKILEDKEYLDSLGIPYNNAPDYWANILYGLADYFNKKHLRSA